jgi:hypothetical protein
MEFSYFGWDLRKSAIAKVQEALSRALVLGDELLREI